MKRILILALSTALLSGCLSAHNVRVDQGVLIEQDSLQYLQSGLTQDQVRKLIGPPANVSTFRPNRWEYLFRSSDSSFGQDKVKKLVLEFDAQGYLTRWDTPTTTAKATSAQP